MKRPGQPQFHPANLVRHGTNRGARHRPPALQGGTPNHPAANLSNTRKAAFKSRFSAFYGFSAYYFCIFQAGRPQPKRSTQNATAA